MRFLSQVYTIARGSVGGITYTANQWHQLIARARTSPVQPGTPFQTGIRTAFDGADGSYRLLSAADKDDWEFYAQTCVYTGPLGNYTVPGRQLFIGTIALVQYADNIPGAPAIQTITTPPLIAGWYNPGQVLVGLYGGVSQGIAIDVTNPTDDPGIAVVDVSIAFNTTRNRYKGPWISPAKTVIAVSAGATTHIEIDRPPGTTGKVIFSRTRMFSAEVSPETPIPHRLSSVSHLRHISVEGPP